jgi:glycosyltransferase involved in cell wall biosynthesis
LTLKKKYGAKRDKFRSAIVLSELRPGGMERVVVHLANGLYRRDIETMVICIENQGELVSELEASDVRLVAMGSKRSMDIGAVFRLRRLIWEFSPSIINIHDYSSSTYAVIANQIAGRVPIVFTSHGLLYVGFDKLRNRCRFFSRWFSGLTAVSEEVAARHKEFLSWPHPVTIIPNGVPSIERDVNLRNKIRYELGCGDTDILFLAVGNPRPEKGFEDLIDAVSILCDESGRERGFLVVIAGKLTDGKYCQTLKQRVQDRGVKNSCRFLGFRADTHALYSAADVFVLSSRSEGLPMVILESMMAGLPVIATRVGGVPKAVGENGMLVDPGQPAQLAKAMGLMLTQDGLIERFGRFGQARTSNIYGVDRMVDDYIDCYRTVMNRKR